MKKYTYLVLGFAALMFLGAGCNLVAQKPVDCGSDKACAEKLVAECKPGSFRILSGVGNLDKGAPKYTILEKVGAGCDVSWEMPEAGALLSGSMKCNVPENITKEKEPIKAMGDYFFSSKFSTCSGELLDKLNTSPGPEMSAEGRQCGSDNICAEILIKSCQRGKFLTSLPDGSEFEFWLVNSSPAGCFADVKATKNSDQKFIGKSMRCVMSPVPTGMNEIRSFLSGIINDKTYSSVPCNGDLYGMLRGPIPENLTNSTAPQAPVENKLPKMAAGKECAWGDQACADSIYTHCSSGSFLSQKSGALAIATQKYTVVGLDGENCKLTMEIYDKTLGWPEKMTCLMPPYYWKNSSDQAGIAWSLGNTLADNKYSQCSGPLKDRMMPDGVKVSSRPSLAYELSGDSCGDDEECINGLLLECKRGNFSVLQGDITLRFMTIQKTSAGCSGTVEDKASYLKSIPNNTFMRPRMSCVFPSSIKNLANIKTLVSNNYKINGVAICSGSLR